MGFFQKLKSISHICGKKQICGTSVLALMNHIKICDS